MPPCDYTTIQGEKIKAAFMSLRAIIWAAHQYHPAYSGTICASTGVGAIIPGTVVNEVLADEAKKSGEIKIGHPYRHHGMRCGGEDEGWAGYPGKGYILPDRPPDYGGLRLSKTLNNITKPWTMSQDLHM
jgi:hypothetical protein